MTTIAPSTQFLAHQFYRAVSTGDRSALTDIVTSDATWTFPGDNTLTGHLHGIDQIATADTHLSDIDAMNTFFVPITN